MAPRRVFLSHTRELRTVPDGRSFVDAAESAVVGSGDVVSDMAYLPASPDPPADVCRDAVHAADVLVLVAGHRYGSPVRDRPELSYTELEYEAATQRGIPRLVFLLDDAVDAPGLRAGSDDGARQLAFRRRLLDSGVTTAAVRSPDGLETAVRSALAALPASRTVGMPAGRLWNLPARSSEFVGRAPLLDALHARLSGRAGAVALTGLAGVGKTTLAVEHAHRYGEDYDVAWWVPANEPSLVADELAELARALRLATSAEPTDVAVARLLGALRERERWLLVFDNADRPEDLEHLLPTGPGHVVVTTRSPQWTPQLTVPEFSRSESAALLRARRPDLAEPDAHAVAEALGDLPLAVDHASTLLSETRLDADSYLRELSERAGRVLDWVGDEVTASAAAPWALAFDQLQHDDPAALQLLTVAAWLGPDPVPLRLASGRPDLLEAPLADDVADPLGLAARLSTLRRRGLAHASPSSLRIHRVPAALLRARSGVDGGDARWAGLVVRLLRAALPADVWNDHATWPEWQRMLPHVLAVLDPDRRLAGVADDADWLTVTAGTYRLARGEIAAAHPLLARGTAARRDRLGPDHPDTLQSATVLGNALHQRGRFAEARDLAVDTLERRRRVLGPDHDDTLKTANNVVAAVWELGEPDRARGLMEDVLARHRRLRGDDDPETLRSIGNLAVVLDDLGEHERFLELQTELLGRRRASVGDDHPSTLTAAHNVADGLEHVGRREEAIALSADTLARRHRMLGVDHPDSLLTAHNHAIFLLRAGDLDGAADLCADTLARREDVLGPEHPHTALTRTVAGDIRRAGGGRPARWWRRGD